MSEKQLRVLLAGGRDHDRHNLVKAITDADPRADVSSASLAELEMHLAQRRFDAVILDCAAVEGPPHDVLRDVGPSPLICLVDARHRDVVLDAVRRGAADVLIKDDAGLYLELLSAKLARLLHAAPRHGPTDAEAVSLPDECGQLAQTLFEHSPNMIFINACGRVVYANRKAAELMGYRREEFYAPDFNFLTLIAPESLQLVKLNFGRHLRGQDVEPYDYTLMTRAGRRIEAIMASKFIHYRGQPAILGIITDISHRKQIEQQLTKARDDLERQIRDRTDELVRTGESLLTEIQDRQRAQQALAESEEHYRIISSLTSDYVYAMSCEDGYPVEWVAGAFEKITGYQPQDVATLDDWLRIMHPDDVPAIQEAAKRCMAGETVESEYRIRTRQGRLRWLYDHVHPIRDDRSGRITAVVGAVRDITDRKQAMEALKESEVKFKTIFENAGGAIFIADAETGYIIECNTQAANLTGLPRDKLIGIHQTQLHPPEEADRYRDKFRQHVAKGHVLDFEGEVQHADGRRIPVWISAQCVSLTDRKVNMGLFLDISAKRRSEEQQVRLTEMLEEKNRELESIIHVASHDFRTPLITICGFAGELQRSCRQLESLFASTQASDTFSRQASAVVSQDIPEAVGLIAASAAKLNALLDGLTRLARFDQPGLEMAWLDMNRMLADVIKTLTYQARHHAVEFRIDPLPDCWGDEQQINQVFSNLLGNALNYLDPARPGLITVTGRRANHHTIYCVEDNGIGIDANNLPDIFKIYYRVNPRQTDGQGLGLAIVRRILSRHNGKVWAESQKDQGSRFFVALPNP